MSEAKATVPEFQVQTEVDLDALLAFRATLKAAADDGDVVPSINDFIVKASALALRRCSLTCSGLPWARIRTAWIVGSATGGPC